MEIFIVYHYQLTYSLKIDPTTDTTSLLSNSFSLASTYGRFVGSVLAPNGMIYYIPMTEPRVFKLDPTTEIETAIGTTYHTSATSSKWQGGALAENGMIYCACFGGTVTQILKINPTTDTTSLVGASLGAGNKISGACCAPNGMIYFAPRKTSKIVMLDPTTEIISYVGTDYGGAENKWFANQLALNGMIYFIPHDYGRVMKLDPTTNTTTLIGSLITGTYRTAVLGLNGKIYCLPFTTNDILEIDPYTDTTRIFTDAIIQGRDSVKGNIALNGNLYFVPLDSDKVIVLNIDSPNLVGTDAIMPADLADLATSNYNKYYNKF